MSEEIKCPECNSKNLEQGYGFAYGGLGVYTTCADCGAFVSKVMDPIEENEDV